MLNLIKFLLFFACISAHATDIKPPFRLFPLEPESACPNMLLGLSVDAGPIFRIDAHSKLVIELLDSFSKVKASIPNDPGKGKAAFKASAETLNQWITKLNELALAFKDESKGQPRGGIWGDFLKHLQPKNFYFMRYGEKYSMDLFLKSVSNIPQVYWPEAVFAYYNRINGILAEMLVATMGSGLEHSGAALGDVARKLSKNPSQPPIRNTDRAYGYELDLTANQGSMWIEVKYHSHPKFNDFETEKIQSQLSRYLYWAHKLSTPEHRIRFLMVVVGYPIDSAALSAFLGVPHAEHLEIWNVPLQY